MCLQWLLAFKNLDSCVCNCSKACIVFTAVAGDCNANLAFSFPMLRSDMNVISLSSGTPCKAPRKIFQKREASVCSTLGDPTTEQRPQERDIAVGLFLGS